MKEGSISQPGFNEPNTSCYYAVDSFLQDTKYSTSYLGKQMERIHANPILVDYLSHATKVYMDINKSINGFLTGFYEMRFAMYVKDQLKIPTLEDSAKSLRNPKKHSSLIDPYDYLNKYPSNEVWK